MPSQDNMIENEQTLSKVYKDFQSSVKHPELYLSVQPKKQEKFKNITKNLYDLSAKLQEKPELDPNVLPELILDSMDEEQIWQQLELRNNQIMTKFLKDTSRLLTLNKDALTIKCRTDNDSSDNESEVSQDSDKDENQQSENDFESDDPSDEELPTLPSTKKKNKKAGKKSIVDDKFFKLSEMEEFLKVEDDKEVMKQKGKSIRELEIDYFEDDESDDEDEEDVKYSDFFDHDDEEDLEPSESKKKSKKRKFSQDSALEEDLAEEDGENEEGEEEASENEEESDDQNAPLNQKRNQSQQSSEEDNESDNENNLPKSTFEARQERLRQRIKEHEEKALGEKPWQLKGEITALTRPKNSLLEEILEFDSTTRPAPVITEETTLRLEDIIRQRIKDKAWDDVVRKFKPIKTPQELRNRLVLDQEKSKESLAQIYEKEYHNQVEKLNPNDAEEKEEEPENHKEIKKLMRALFMKLDALSNFHYTPKPAMAELRIITNTPAIEVEEVAPVAVSNAKLLAPEEIRDRAKGDVLGKTERDRTDKKRERRKKKMKQKIIGKIKEQRMEEKQKMGLSLTTKEEKSKAMKSVLKHRNIQKMSTNGGAVNAPKSSKAFFTQLQDKITSGKDVKAKKKTPKDQVSAKRLKL